MNLEVQSFNFSQYVARDYREVSGGDDWIRYGADNLFPQYLIDLAQTSPTHSALVTSKALLIYSGVRWPVDLDARLALEKWNLKNNLRRAVVDYTIQGGFALELNWSIDRSTLASVTHLPFESLRAAPCNEHDVVEWYWYSADWSDRGIEPVALKSFSPDDAVEYPKQVLYVSPFAPGNNYYPKPDYVGALNYIELEKEIGVFHINNIQNGLAPSFSIHFKNGIPSEEERAAIRADIEGQLKGPKGAGKVWITYSDLPEQKPDFEPIPVTDADKQYQFLSEECTSKIMVGHRVTNPLMFGVAVPGKLGGGQELAESADLFNRNVVQPAVDVVEDALKTVLNTAGVTPRLETMSEEVDLEASLAHFEAVGEEMGEEWELVDERPVDYEMEAAHDAVWNFASVPSGSYEGDSKQDSEIIRVRYVYAPESTSGDSREFCVKMVASKKVYKKEDIVAAGRTAVNPGFGFQGADTYDIWKFKGGPRCHHYWMRQTYLKKDNSQISVNRAKRLITAVPVKDRDKVRLPVNEPEVAKLPKDMPHKGFHPNNPNKPKDAQ